MIHQDRVFGTPQSKEEKQKQKPWVERYRPKMLNEILNQESTTKILYENFVSGNTMHYIFSGSPGTGKTSTILAFCKYLYGKNFKDYVLQVNAANDVKLSLGEIIYNFCKRSVYPIHIPHPHPQTPNQTIIVNFKFVICDEADSLSSETQNALHKSIDYYSFNTRFCFLCNYQNKIVKTISSRCHNCYFSPLTQDICIQQMKFVCEKEKASYTEQALHTIYEEYNGDLRKCISTIQAVYLLNSYISKENFIRYIHKFTFPELESLFLSIKNKDIQKLNIQIDEIVKQGFTPREILHTIIDYIHCNNQEFEYNDDDNFYEFYNYISNAQIKCTQNSIPEFLILEFILETHRMFPKL